MKSSSFAEKATTEGPLVKEFYNLTDQLSIVNDFVIYTHFYRIREECGSGRQPPFI